MEWLQIEEEAKANHHLVVSPKPRMSSQTSFSEWHYHRKSSGLCSIQHVQTEETETSDKENR